MRRVRKTQKQKRHRKHRGGLMHLEPAALSYSLAGSDASRASLGQGADYLKYHQGQHGGAAPLSAITNSALEGALRQSAHLNGLDKAYADIAGLSDQQGGRRRRTTRAKKHGKKNGKKHDKKKGGKRSKKHSKRSKKGGKRSKKHSKKHGRTRRHKRGGSHELEFAPFPSKGMLLSGAQYSQAGLNPEWKSAVEFDSAMQRSAM